MIRNIPNKYTIQDLSREIDFLFEDSYDFLYLPCDIKVILLLFRIIVMLDTALLTLLILPFSNSFIRNFIIRSGSSSEVKRYFCFYLRFVN